MRRAVPWIDGPNIRPAKIGTIPMVVQVHGSDLRKLVPGNTVRIRDTNNGKWSEVRVNKVDPQSGHFQADR